MKIDGSPGLLIVFCVPRAENVVNRSLTLLAVLAVLIIGLTSSRKLTSDDKPARAEDWPTWRHDAQRSAYSKQELANQLHLQWVRDYPPQKTAWLDQPHMVFDRVPEPVVLGATLFFGSARNDTLTALDTRTGADKWVFHAGGPIRFAPVAWKDRVYFVSDDGHLYCLAADTGKLLWRFRGGPSDRRILGNGRLISTWPARGAPVIVDGTVYFAAGIWPFMGIFLHALDARTGAVVWTNDGDGSPYRKQPHNSDSFAGIAPQGALVAQGDMLLIPGGRSVPACYDRATGKMLHYRLAENNKLGGGSDAAVVGRLVFNGGIFDLPTGVYLGPFGKLQPPPNFKTADEGFKTGANAIPVGKLPVLSDDLVVGLANGKYQSFDPNGCHVEIVEGTDSKGIKTQRAKFTQAAVTLHDAPARLESLIRSGSRLYAGSPGKIEAIDLPLPRGKSEKPVVTWEASVTGRPASLLSADDRLFAVTLEGQILCFGPEKVEPKTHPLETRAPAPGEPWAGQARRILETARVRDGYCLVWGVGTGQLLMELARQSNLSFIAVDPDPEKVQHLRRQLIAAGLHGERVAVHTADPTEFPFPPYLASLIVSEDLKSARLDAGPAFANKLFQALRPYGGVACLEIPPGDRAAFGKQVSELALPNAKIKEALSLTLLSREGALPGAGNWTHEHADAANTRVSRDQLVKVPLGVLWFGGSSNEGILPRHGHGPQPQVIDGRLIIEGVDMMRAMDIYTGRILWESRLTDVGKIYNSMPHQPGANATGSNYVSTSDGIYAIHDRACVRLDVATGKKIGEFHLPKPAKTSEQPAWGYLNVSADYLVGGTNPSPASGEARDETLPRQLQLWNVAQRRAVATLEGHTDQVTGVAFSPDGKTLATTSADKSVRLWDESGKLETVLAGHTKRVTTLAFSPDGKTLATGSDDATVILWDTAAGKRVAALREHTNPVTTVAFSPDGKLLATGSSDSTVKVWDASEHKVLAAVEGLSDEITSVAFSPDGKTLAAASSDKTVRLWDVSTKVFRATLDKHKDAVTGVAFAPDGKTLATGSKDKTVQFWDVASGRNLATLEKQTSPVLCLAYTLDGKTLAVGTLDAAVYLCDAVERKVQATLPGLPGAARSLAFSPDGKTMALGCGEAAKTPNELLSSSKQLVVMDRRDGRVLWSIEAHNSFRHNAICLGEDRLYCVDQLSVSELLRLKRGGQAARHKPRLLALELRTGKEVWSTDADVFGTWLSYSAKHDVLVEAGRVARDTLFDEPKGMRAYRAGNGKPLWYDKAAVGPAMIHGDMILKDQGACDLLTGKLKMREHPITGKPVPWTWTRNYGCNTPLASEHLLTFRSGAAGFCDLEHDGGTGNFGGFRSGCTNNLIVAGGLLNVPDYTRSCTCSYQNQASLALVPTPEVEIWTRFPIGPIKATTSSDKAPLPIKRLGLTLAAPGHRRADDGCLWLNDYEHLHVKYDRFGFYTGHASKITEAGGSWPWVVASGCRGITQLTLAVRTDGADDGVRYTVRLHFADPDNDKPDQRVFGVAVQDNMVLPRLDVAREAGGRNRGLVKEFKGIKVKDTLEVRFVPGEGAATTPATVPFLCGIEIIREEE
jgi:outer membrane protein assembly factor BamB